MFFGQQLFGAVFTSVGQNLLDIQLANRLTSIPDTSPQLIQSTSATKFLNLVPVQYHAAALVAYNRLLHVCFQVGLIVACLSIIGALGIEWRTVKKNLTPKKPDGQRAAEEGMDKSEKGAPEADAEALQTAQKTEERTEIDREKDEEMVA